MSYHNPNRVLLLKPLLIPSIHSYLIDAKEADGIKALKAFAKKFEVSVAALTIKISGVLKGEGF